MINLEINKNFQIAQNTIIVNNIRNKLIISIDPFKMRIINNDVIEILSLLNKGLTFEEICLKKKFSINSRKKLKNLINELYDSGILIEGRDEKSNIFKESFINYPLERLFISITENCNLKCKHCYVECNEKDNIKKNMSLDILFKCIDDCIKLGMWQVDLTGGEIFCRKDIFTILDYLKNKNLIVNLFTNGTLINRKIIGKLKKYTNIIKIIISFDSLNKDIYEEFRKSTGSFDKLTDAINLIKEANIPMSFNVPYMCENKNEIYDIINFLTKNYSKDILLYPIFQMGRANNIKITDDIDNFIKIKKRFLLSSNNNYVSKNLKTICGVGESFIFIESSGEIALCPTLSQKYDSNLRIGNVHKDNLKDIWVNHELLKKFRVANCKYINTCTAKKICKGGCRCKAYFESNNSLYGQDNLSCLINNINI